MRESFSVYLPRWPLRRDHYRWLDGFDRIVGALQDQRLPIRSQFGGKPELLICDEKVPNDVTHAIRNYGGSLLGKTDFKSALHLKFEYDVPSEEVLGREITTSDGGDIDRLAAWRDFVQDEIHDEVAIFMMAMDLSSPGSGFHGPYGLKGRKGVAVRDSKAAHVGDDFGYMAENGIAGSSDLAFPKVWKALNSTNGLRNGVPDTPFGKLVSAITYLYAGVSTSARFFDVVWACYGLEGFFGEGAGSRAKQVEEKVSLFLSLDQAKVRLLLKKLYELRSKFIHGNSAASSALVALEPPPGKVSTDEWDAKSIGAYFLIETARQCIRKDIRRQEFGLVLR